MGYKFKSLSLTMAIIVIPSVATQTLLFLEFRLIQSWKEVLIQLIFAFLLLSIAVIFSSRWKLYKKKFIKEFKSHLVLYFIPIFSFFFGVGILSKALFNRSISPSYAGFLFFILLALLIFNSMVVELLGYPIDRTLEQGTDRTDFFPLAGEFKNKMNPHFLFNCLNTLSVLVYEDSRIAESFINNLSKVYHHLFSIGSNEITNLENEIQFARSYFHLLKIRHNIAIKLDINVDNKLGKYFLPSHTLQILIENAVRHNIIMKDHPLEIMVKTNKAGKLIFSNNLQVKKNTDVTRKKGLNLIAQRYLALTNETISIVNDGKQFTVTIPLVKNYKNGNFDYRG